MSLPKTPSIISPRQLEAVGTALYGERWQNQVSHAAGFSQGLLSMMVSGDRPIVNRDFLERLAKLCAKRAAELDRHAATLTEALHRRDA